MDRPAPDEEFNQHLAFVERRGDAPGVGVVMGWPSVARMGLSQIRPEVTISSELAALAGKAPLDAAALGVSAENLRQGRASEGFDLRTPQHVSLAGDLGLGEFDPRRIDYRTIKA